MTTFEEATETHKLASWRSTGWMEVPHHSTGELRGIHYAFIEDAARYPPLPNFAQPALLIHGTKDQVVPISLSRAFAAAHPNVQLIEMEAGHDMVEVMDEIIANAVPFLLME